MDFQLTEDQLAFQASAREFARRELAPHAAVWDAEEIFPVDVIRRALAQAGCGPADIDYVEATSEDKAEVQDFLEQHRLLDLDGDGYEEPYIVTIHKTSHKVARIVADFGEDDIIRLEDVYRRKDKE